MEWVDNTGSGFPDPLRFNLFINGNVTGVPWTTIAYGTETFSKSSGGEFYDPNASANLQYSVPVTMYSWSITVDQFNYFNSNNNLQYRIN